MKPFWKLVKWSGIGLGVLITIVATGIGFPFARAAWDHRPKVDCPILAYLRPIPRRAVSSTDYIEIVSLSAWRYPVRIRIHGDGQVERDTTFVYPNGEIFGCPLHESDQHLQIPQKAAAELLTRAEERGFCRLCSTYRSPDFIYDAGTEGVTSQLGGGSRRFRIMQERLLQSLTN